MKKQHQPGPKKSPNTKTNNKRREAECRTEEKTAIGGPKSKAIPPKKQPSKASISADKKGSSTDVKLTKSKSNVNTAYDKTVTEEKEKPKKKEKWSGEEAACKFTKALNSVNMKEEYEEIQKMSVQSERCKIWQAHSSRNRNPDYKCYDDNRVIVQMCKSDYINGTKINVPNFAPLVYLIQLPKVETVDAVEEFWRVIFQDQCQSLHIIARSDELQNPGIEKLFAQESGAYLYANGFFINTRKVEKKDSGKADVFIVELLPEGCSNSVMCTVYMHTYWKQFTGPDRFGAQIKAAQQIAKNEHGTSPTVIASVNGAGRNAALLSLAVVVDQLTKGKEPKINDIVRTIREQRPLSVDSFPQYISLYLATNWLIKAKVSSNNTTEDMISRIKKFNEKATQSVPNSTMKHPTEES
ncbi:hypothetical protein GCK72_000774 [Caenorhabditis remanei]|uniref:Tyrosine-protein phosphatase domain-containing protein n=1 Tax=Caenorhabditis remanei TaxID=31234 RepID=A0A6A5HP09_CAERE|nr:hypothetical protein GCK72_000774 [Caenorhabditis remanei]KAF1768961.1 hypothetical protein GCK72_000774 [Caenorhabditis remanei]